MHENPSIDKFRVLQKLLQLADFEAQKTSGVWWDAVAGTFLKTNENDESDKDKAHKSFLETSQPTNQGTEAEHYRWVEVKGLH